MKITTFINRTAPYNETMPVESTIQPHVSRSVRVCALIGAGMLLLMLLTQLYSYEDFASVLTTILPFSDQPLSVISAALLVIVELFSLPYLLEMKLSRLMRVISQLFGLVVALFWLFTSLTSAHAANSALFSTTFDLPGGVLAVLWSMVLAVLTMYITYSNSRPVSSS